MKTLFKMLMCACLLFAVGAGYSQCYAGFGFNNYSNGVGDVSLLDTVYANDSIITAEFIWTFGDGTSDTGIANPFILHQYDTSGVFTICLQVVDTVNNCNVQQCITDTVNLCADIVQSFGITLVGFGLDQFNGPTNIAGLTINWSCGDGFDTSAFDFVHQYNANGYYNVGVGIYVPGCRDSITLQNNVMLCQGFYPRYTVTPVSYNPYTAAFVAINPNILYTYTWQFGDGTYGTGSNISHIYNHNGVDSVILAVSYNGCYASIMEVPIEVDRCGLNPDVYEGADGVIGYFDVRLGADSSQGAPIDVLWDFPGGIPATSANYSDTVIYPALGTYNTTLYISTQWGCVDTFSQLLTLTTGYYSISGTVSVANADTNTITIYLIKQDSIGHLTLIDSSIQYMLSGSGITSSATYNFNYLPADSYYVKAALNIGSTGYANNLPTYYTNAISWVGATPVYVGPYSAANINITLTPGVNPGGPGFVGGYVSQGAGLVLQQGGGNITRSVGDAIAGVQINLLTAADEAVAYTYTDINGQYRFNNLAYGNYKIYAEQLNKIPVPVFFTLSPSDSFITNLNISINSDSSYATAISAINPIAIQDIYPNPAVNRLEVELNSAQTTNATVKLIDMLGRTVTSANTRLTAGNNRLELNIENMASGVYQLVIQTSNQHVAWKVVKAN